MSIEIIDKHTAKLVINVGSGENRKRHTKRVKYEKKRDLKAMHDAFETEVKRNPLTDMTVAQLVRAYITHCELNGLKATTLVGYEVAYKRIESLCGAILAKNLTPHQLEEKIAEMARNPINAHKKPYSPKSIANTVGLLRAAYDFAIKTGQLEDNPCKFVALPKKRQKQILTFSEDEVVKFKKALDAERLDYKVGYELCLFCGMRKGEVLGLKEDDIDHNKKCVSILKTRNYVDGENVEQDPKTVRSRRALSIPGFVLEDIKALVKEHAEADFYCCDYLIQDGFGRPMQSATFTNHIKVIERANKLPFVTVHGLRHTFATMLNSDGIDIARISAELGHADTSVTLRVYTHVFGDVSESSKGIASAINDRFK